MWKQRARRLLQLFDRYGLLTLALFLLAFIPLYPKLPLLEAIPGYLVKVRIEDILVLGTGLIWLIQAIRGKINWRSPFLTGVVLYVGVGLLSVLSGIFLLQTIPLEPLHVGKSLFHFFRYLEYFSVFFFMYSGITSLKQAKVALVLVSVVVVLVTIYGVGQKSFSWPVFSTMNREFSKGALLSLGENARVQSTFAGHYDMAAFLVIALPILLAAVLTNPRWLAKVWFGGAAIGGLWLLLASGSKVALAAGALGLYLTVLLFLRQHQRLFRTALALTVAASVALMCLGLTLALNLQNPALLTSLQTVRRTPLIAQLAPLTKVIDKATLLVANQQTPTAGQLPIDVYETIPEYETKTVVEADGTLTTIQVEKGQTWSDNALKYGLSLGIRFDTLWPQAFKGLSKSLYLGSGYGTLNKTGNTTFVEADSTDNNLLRTLGETGILGFIAFYGVIWIVLKTARLTSQDENWVTKTLSLGLIGATVGLLINALMIDVFVASKVAFTYWALAGLTAKVAWLSQPQAIKQLKLWNVAVWRARLSRHWPLLLAIGCLVFLVHRNPLVLSSDISNWEANPTATAAVTTVRCWLTDHHWQLCRPAITAHSSTSYLYGGYLLLFFSLWNNVGVYYYAHLLLAILTLILLATLSRRWLRATRYTAIVLLLQVGFLFFSWQFFSPVDENLALVVGLLSAVSIRKWQQLRNTNWLIICMATLIAFFSLLIAIPLAGWWFVATPFLALSVSVLVRYCVTHTPISSPILNKLIIAGTVSLVCLSFLSIGGQTRWADLLQEYRGLAPGWRAQSVRVANDFFSGRKTKSPPETGVPWLMTTTNPYFYDFYSNGLYQLLPLSLSQPFTSQAQTVWGDHDYSSATTLAQGLLDQHQEVFISDFDLTPTIGQPEWQQLRTAFDFDLTALGCDEKCNLYQLSQLPGPAPLTIARDKSTYSFTIYNHQYDVQDPRLTRNITQLQQVFTTDAAVPPDFMIATSNKLHQQTFTRLTQRPDTASDFPAFFMADNRNQNTNADFLQFRTPHDLFLFNI